MSKIAEKADSLAVEKAARRARDRVARRTIATTAVGGEEPPQKIGSPVPKPKPRIQRKGKAQAIKGFSAEIEEARKTLTKKGMSDAEKYAAIATIGVLGRVLPPLASMTLGSIKTIFRFIRSPKAQSTKALKESVKKLKKDSSITKTGLVVDRLDEAGGYDLKKPRKPDMLKHGQYNKGGTKKMNTSTPVTSIHVPDNPTKEHIAEARGIIRTTEKHKGKLTKGMQLDYDYAVQIMINSGSSNKASIGKKQQIKDTTRRDGPVNNRPQIMKGGAYKGKKHSYAAGGKVNKLNF